MSTLLKHHVRSTFPALNIHWRKETVATDTIYFDVPSIASGSTQAQLYCGQKFLVWNVFGMKTEKHFVDILEDTNRQLGVMDNILSDSAQVEITGCVKYILHDYVIGELEQWILSITTKFYWKGVQKFRTYH